MELPQHSVTLSAGEISELSQHLSVLRHNINNYLSLMTAAAEVMARKPEIAGRLIDSLLQQPSKIVDEVQKFSQAFEKALEIKR